ncbi:MAG: hypothetical protein ABI654_03450 [Betaproteobacteria bacterium]
MKRSFSLARRHRQRGFLVIAAVFLLVVLAGLVAYLTTVSTTSQAASAADFNSARAYQAARAGIEWGAFHVIRAGSFKATCDTGPGFTATNTLTFGSNLSGFAATVTCTSAGLSEGGSSIRAYSIVSNACNEAACPTVTTAGTYVERQLSLTLTE